MKDKCKVVQLSSVHPSNDTRIFHKICKSLVQAGYSVDLIIQHEKNEKKEGVNIIALPLAKKKSDRIFKIIPKLLKISLRYPKSTIFHFHDPELILIGLFLKSKGYKVVYDVHEDVPKDLLTKEWIPKAFRKLLSNSVKVLERFASKHFDYVITVVDSIAHRFENYTNSVIQIRNYPILQKSIPLKTQLCEGNKYIVYIGSLTYRRGLPELIKAIESVKDSSIKLLIGGAFGDPELERYLKSQHGWGKVEYLGWVEQDSLINVLSNAKAGMVVLRDIPSHRESFPVKMFEYMHSGIPIIASNFPLWEEVVQDSGILVNPFEPLEIAKAIDWIVENPKQAKEMGERGRKLVNEKYNWGKEKRTLLELYSNLMLI